MDQSTSYSPNDATMGLKFVICLSKVVDQSTSYSPNDATMGLKFVICLSKVVGDIYILLI